VVETPPMVSEEEPLINCHDHKFLEEIIVLNIYIVQVYCTNLKVHFHLTMMAYPVFLRQTHPVQSY
jgi:hypothetical protein